MFHKSRAALDKALSLDDSLGEAHAWRARDLCSFEYRWKEDDAFEWLDTAYEERDFMLAFLIPADPTDAAEQLRRDPRGQALLRKMNLVE
jgi:hypothetical protein